MKASKFINDEDDIQEVGKKLGDQWYPREKLVVQEQKQSGEIVNRNYSMVHAGDFVDVKVVARIQETAGIRLRFEMTEVTLLQTKSKVMCYV